MKTLVCFGDSNTYGTPPLDVLGESRRYSMQERWPSVLRTGLGEGWHVVEEGLPGRTTVHDDPIEGAHRNGLTVLPALLESHNPIDLVSVMLGTNDLKTRFSVGAEDIGFSLERLLGVILASRAGPAGKPPAVLLIAPVPIREVGLLEPMFRGGAAKSRELGRVCADVAKRAGVGFLDAGTVAETDPGEGIHLSVAAHAALAKAVHGWMASSRL